jgi:exodeoxyribonuclease-3
MRIVSWNINGIRSVLERGFLDWLGRETADLVCLQEVKSSPTQLPAVFRNNPDWTGHWNHAERAGYSGTGILVRNRSSAVPFWVERGFGHPAYEVEGRTLVADLDDLLLVCAYFPKGYADDPERLAFKQAYTRDMIAWVRERHAEGRAVVLCGDFNIAHREIDLAHPSENRRTSGFLPAERALVDGFLDAGLVDVFRTLHPEGGRYSWWTHHASARERNLGWRIDYFLVSRALVPKVTAAEIHPEVMGSDHCPVSLELAGV